MDLVYMPEVLSYGALRHPQYRDYEQPWNKDYFNYGKSTTRLAKIQQRQQQNYLQQKQQQQQSFKKSCTICKENKRRTLAAYIRGKKGRNNSCTEIHEEIEEKDEEEEEEEDLQKLEKEENKETDIVFTSDGMKNNSNQLTIKKTIDEK